MKDVHLEQHSIEVKISFMQIERNFSVRSLLLQKQIHKRYCLQNLIFFAIYECPFLLQKIITILINQENCRRLRHIRASSVLFKVKTIIGRLKLRFEELLTEDLEHSLQDALFFYLRTTLSLSFWKFKKIFLMLSE